MTFTSPFTVPVNREVEQARQEREDRYDRHEGLWIASWTSGPRSMRQQCAHVVRRRLDRRPICGRRNAIKYHHEVRYVPINEKHAPTITCRACYEKAGLA